MPRRPPEPTIIPPPTVTLNANAWRQVAAASHNQSFQCSSDDAKRDKLRNVAAYIDKALNGCDGKNIVTLNPSGETMLLLANVCANKGLACGDEFRKALSKMVPVVKEMPPVKLTPEELKAIREAAESEERGDFVFEDGDLERVDL